MPFEVFKTIDEITDLVPNGLLIPADREDLRVPREENVSPDTTSPIEVGFILFTAGGFFHPYKQRLEFHEMKDEKSTDFLNQSWMNHVGRAVTRVALDPDRYAPIDMFAACKNEEQFAGFPNANDHKFFKHFVKTWGVLLDRQ